MVYLRSNTSKKGVMYDSPVILAAMVVAMAVVLMESVSAASIKSMDKLVQQDDVDKQLLLIEKLMEEMLSLSHCDSAKEHLKNSQSGSQSSQPSSDELTVTPASSLNTMDEPSSEPSSGEPTDTPAAGLNVTNILDSGDSPDATTSTMTEAPSRSDHDCDYSALSPTHTMVKPKKETCEILPVTYEPLTDDVRQQILQLHNMFRSEVASGNTTVGDPGPQPPAANMKEMVWNDELAKVAQAWSEQCMKGHDRSGDRRMCTRKYQVGQNIHYFWGFEPNPDWHRAVTEWFDEVWHVSNSLVASFGLVPGVKIGHYTQVVWAKTFEIGCGIVYYEIEKNGIYFPNSKIYVCNYGPAGNVLEAPFYIEGPAASQCPSGVSSNYPLLCA